MVASSSTFAPVSLTRAQTAKLESRMKQQVQDAVLARSAQLSRGNAMDSEWKLVASLGRLKTFKTNGVDSFNSTSGWATTLTRSTRATACNVNDRISVGASGWATRSHSSAIGRGRFGRLSFSRRTVGGTSNRHDQLDPHPPLKSFRTVGQVQGHYRDIVDAYHASNSSDFLQQQRLLSPIVTDAAVLRSVRATEDSYLGIKWLVENSFAGKRDYCFIEMVGYTVDTNGHEIGFVAMASVDVPECPDLSDVKVMRVRMKRTMLVIPTSDTPKVTSEIFVMGASEANDSSIIANAQYRLNMAILNDVSIVIDSRNIAKQSLAPQQNWVPDESRPICTVCSRRFNFMYRRRHHCRLCGDVVCRTCFVMRSVPGAGVQEDAGCRPTESVICQTKFCVRCVMGLRAIDKRLNKFTEQVSKMLSLNSSTVNWSDEEQSRLSASEQRGLSVTYFKRGSNVKHNLDLDQLFRIPSPDEQNQVDHKSVNPRATVAVSSQGEAGRLGSKILRPSLSVDPSHSNSYMKLSVLSRHSSAASLTDSQVDPAEEKVLLDFDMISHTVAI